MIENPRIRVLVGTYGLRLAVALAVVGVLAIGTAGWLAYDPARETVTHEAHQQEVVTTTGTSAVVTGGDTLWPEGTELQNKPVYLFNATRGMTVAAETELSGAREGTITHEWNLTLKAEADGEVFWSETETLANRTTEGTSARTAVEINATELRERMERRQLQVGDAGTVSAVLTLTVEYETGRYEGTRTLSTPVVVGKDAYGLDNSPTDRANHATTVRTTVTRPPNRTVLFGLVGIGLAGLVAAAGVVRAEPDEIDVEEARNEVHRQRYDEWISPGVLPDGLGGALLAVESLEDVVDVAIDTNERVIEDRRRDVYAVIGEDVVYYYSPEGSWEEASFPGFEAGDGEVPVEPGGDGPGDD